MKTTVFVHMAKKNPVQEHLLRVYEVIGFPGNEDYLEPPTWVSVCAGMLHPEYSCLRILRSAREREIFAQEVNTGVYGSDVQILGSVLDATKSEWQEVLNMLDPFEESKVEVFLGGYINPSELHGSFTWVESPAALPGADVHARPDYSLFEGEEVIARLQMSTGCLFRCAFCTVPQQVHEVAASKIFAQVYSWAKLKVRYVYLDDKTFGQAPNWEALSAVRDAIQREHPEFVGFIIQTTVGELLDKYERFYALGVRYAEIGVEIPDDAFLKKMNKPYRMAALNKLMAMQRDRMLLGAGKGLAFIMIIPNILFAVPGDDYTATFKWLKANVNLISHINPFILSYYEEAKNPDALMGQHVVGKDDDENRYDRSWLLPVEVELCEKALRYATLLVERSWRI